MKYEPIKGGLRVESHGAGGYFVIHEASNLTAIGRLRQRRFAEQARDELLATGVDFTAPAREIQSASVKERWQDVYYRWRNRTTAKGDQLMDLDHETFEYYPASTRYGQFIPSEAQAAEMRELAARLRRDKKIPVDRVTSSGQYVAEFARMGLVFCEEGNVVWIGD